jgi:hypothetical protein
VLFLLRRRAAARRNNEEATVAYQYELGGDSLYKKSPGTPASGTAILTPYPPTELGVAAKDEPRHGEMEGGYYGVHEPVELSAEQAAYQPTSYWEKKPRPI